MGGGGGPALKDAVSDDDRAGGEELGVYDDVDNWEMQRDKVLLEATTAAAGRGRHGASAAGHQREVFALSGTDSDDSDFSSSVRKVKEKKRKKKKGAEKEKEEEEGESMADSDVEEGGPEAGDDLRAWGSRKKHFYGGKCKESLFYYIVAGSYCM